MDNFEKAQEIAAKARNSISEFCMNECKAYCCRKGYITIHEKQLDAIADKNTQEKLNKEGALKELPFSARFQLNFSNSLGGCPALIGTKCSIHKDPNRPKVCQEFPIFIVGDKVKISPRCLAQQENKFFPYIKEFQRLGFEVTNDMSI